MWRLDAVRAEGSRPTPATPSLADLRNKIDPLACSTDDDHPPIGDSNLAQLQAHFWAACEAEVSPCWMVPMGRDLEIMPWLPHRSCGMLEAIWRARRVHGRTGTQRWASSP